MSDQSTGSMLNSEETEGMLRATGPSGMNDVLPQDHEYFTYIKKILRHRCRQAGFRRISTPIFEKTEIIKKALAEEADLIERRMYSLRDPDGVDLTVRSGNTIGIARAYVEHAFDDMPQPMQFYYLEQQARFSRNVNSSHHRTFHQFGLEVIGEDDAALDAQVIFVAHQIHKDLKIDQALELQLNSLGSTEDRDAYISDLRDFFLGKERSIPPEYRHFIEKEPMHLFMKDDEDLKILCEMAPSIDKYWSDESKQYFKDLTDYLDELGVPYKVNHKFFRKLPYYSGVIFEFWEKKRGRSRAVGGGGRYDNLIERLGGESVPAVNYIGGLERIVTQMKINKSKAPSKDNLQVFVAQLGKEAKKKCLPLLHKLHDEGIQAIGAIGKGSMNEQIALAQKFKVPYMVLMGLTEVREGKAIIREMAKGTQKHYKLEEILPELVRRLGKENLDKYTPGDLFV